MAIIALEGVHFHARHGFYEEERITGNHFVLDIYIEADADEAAAQDELYEEYDTARREEKHPLSVNYGTVYELCKIEMRKPTKLLETIAQRIADRLHEQFSNIRGVKIKVKKLHPPLGGIVECAWVEIATGTFKIPTLRTLKRLKALIENWKDLKNLEKL